MHKVVSNTGSPITAKEIGRHLGLSQPTVSRILSGATGHRVSAETRRRVLEAAAEMGYRPNAIARSLRRRRTNIVGFYTGYGYLDARNPFQAELIGGLQRACHDRQVDLLLHGVFRGNSTDDIFGRLVDGRIDGLFINTYADDPLVASIRDSFLPAVAIADAVTGIPSIVPDDAGGTRMLLDYLWEQGHRRIGYLRPENSFTSVERRVETFLSWCAERGIPATDAPMFELNFEYAETALEAILEMPAETRPTAVCCWNDMTACDLLYNCTLRGVAVPESLAIVGFDGLMTDPRLNSRALMTVGASWADVSKRAMDYLMRLIDQRNGGKQEEVTEGESGPEEVPFLTCLPVSLMRGDTA